MLRIASPLFLAAAAVAATAGTARAQDDFKQRPPEPPPAQPAPAAPALTKPPKLKAEVQPTYPPEALAAGLSADVTMQIDIDAEGKVTAVTVTKGAGNGFDEAAREAARRMEFEPAEIDGKPGAIRIEYTMRFRPAVPAPPPAAAAEPEPPPPPPPPPTRLIARGRAREKGTRDPVASASVSVTALDPAANPGLRETFASTDDDGRFVLETSAPPGTKLRMVLSSGEHDPCIRDIEVPADSAQPLELTCIIAPYRGGRYETVVAAPRAGDEATRHTISQPEMTTVPGTFGDPLRVIQNLPGVARSPYGLGLLIIRGSSPQDSGVYVDGHRVPLLYHFLGGPSILTPDLLDRIDFYPGGFGVRYGRATAGVVDVTTRSEPVRRVHGSADVDFIDSSAYIEGPLGGSASGGLAARRSYIDTLLPFFIPEREGSTAVVVTPVYYDYQARITRNAGRGRLSLFVFGSEDSLKVIAQDPNQGDLDLGTAIGLHRVIGTWAVSAGNWTSVLSPSYGYDHVSFGAGEVGAKGWAHVLGLREDVTRSIGTKLKLAFGLDGEFRFDSFELNAPLPPERRTYGRTMPSPERLARTLANLGAAAYTELLWDPHPTVRIAPGIRFDYFHYSSVGLTSFDPRLVVRWARTPTQTFKVGAGIFHQNPQPNELDPQFGNPNLELLWADQYHAGIEQGITRALSLEASLYYLRRHNLPIASARVGADGRLEGYTSEGYGRGYGLELRLRHAVTQNFYGWISYTVSRSEAVLSLQDSPTEPVPEYRPTMFDQTHNLILVASRRFGAWELGTRFRLVSGIPETPLSEGIYDADFNRHDPRRGPPGSVRRQLFHQLDVRAERTFTFDAWRFAVYLDVQNVYNAENPEATIHDYRYRNEAPVRGLPILPVLGVRGRF